MHWRFHGIQTCVVIGPCQELANQWRQGMLARTLVIFQSRNIHEDAATLSSVLLRYGCIKTVPIGKRAMGISSFGGDTFLSMSLEDAIERFAEIRIRDVSVWNTMIRAYLRNGHAEEAVQLFEQMQQDNVMPNKLTFVSLVCVCTKQAALAEGKRLHTRIIGAGLGSDIIVGTALISMYGKCGNLETAQRTFDGIADRDVVSWNAVIAVNAQFDQGKHASRLFGQMKCEAVIPDKVTFISMVSSWSGHAACPEKEMLHACIVGSEFKSDAVVGTALVTMYGRAGSLPDARMTFETVSERDTVSWNSMIAICAQNDHSMDALILFDQMQEEASMPDRVTFVNTLPACICSTPLLEGKKLHARIVGCQFKLCLKVSNALLNMYSKSSCVEEAWKIFSTMPEWDSFSWNGMITAYGQSGQSKDALELFHQMHQEGVIPDNVTLVSMLSACSSWVDLIIGKRMHACIMGSGFATDTVVETALITMYSKCGSLEAAQGVFDKMAKKDEVSWTSMIAAYAQHGRGKNALLLFDQMKGEGFMPNRVTFLTILSACSHAGLVDEAYQFFTCMYQEHGILPAVKHFNCIVDLLGRAGRLDEAEEIIQSMPFRPTATSWTSLLGACKTKDDVNRGIRTAEQLFKMDSKDAASYVMLSNIYAGSVGAD